MCRKHNVLVWYGLSKLPLPERGAETLVVQACKRPLGWCVCSSSQRFHAYLSRNLVRWNSEFSSHVRDFKTFLTFSVWIQGRWNNIYALPPVIQPQCPCWVYDLNIRAAGAHRYHFWDALLSKDIKRCLIQDCIACIFRNPPREQTCLEDYL